MFQSFCCSFERFLRRIICGDEGCFIERKIDRQTDRQSERGEFLLEIWPFDRIECVISEFALLIEIIVGVCNSTIVMYKRNWRRATIRITTMSKAWKRNYKIIRANVSNAQPSVFHLFIYLYFDRCLFSALLIRYSVDCFCFLLLMFGMVARASVHILEGVVRAISLHLVYCIDI